MPELCEVLLISTQLNEYLRGEILENVKVIGGKYLKNPPENLDNFVRTLKSGPHKVVCVRNKGKLIIFRLESDTEALYILSGLGMNGYWGKKKEKHSAIHLKFVGGKEIFYTDPRRFGNVDFFPPDQFAAAKAKIASLAKTLLSNYQPYVITKKKFVRNFGRTKKSWPLVKALLDQKAIVSGIGNYLYSEICYQAKIDPFCIVENVDDPVKLYDACKEVVEKFKSSPVIEDFQPFSEVDKPPSKLNVYRKKLDPDGNPVLHKTGAHGRTIWFVKLVKKKDDS